MAIGGRVILSAKTAVHSYAPSLGLLTDNQRRPGDSGNSPNRRVGMRLVPLLSFVLRRSPLHLWPLLTIRTLVAWATLPDE